MTDMLGHEQILNDQAQATEGRWPVPPGPDVPNAFPSDILENHRPGLSLVPVIEGAADALRPPGKPERISLSDGDLTVVYGPTGQFHLCTGRTEGAVKGGGQAPVARRRSPKTGCFRGLDPEGHPRLRGLRMENGAGAPARHPFFPNPFITPGDQLAGEPGRDRLAIRGHVRRTRIHLADGAPDRRRRGDRA